MLDQLVSERIGLENDIVLSFSSHHGFVGDRKSDVVLVAGSLVRRPQPCWSRITVSPVIWIMFFRMWSLQMVLEAGTFNPTHAGSLSVQLTWSCSSLCRYFGLALMLVVSASSVEDTSAEIAHHLAPYVYCTYIWIIFNHSGKTLRIPSKLVETWHVYIEKRHWSRQSRSLSYSILVKYWLFRPHFCLNLFFPMWRAIPAHPKYISIFAIACPLRDVEGYANLSYPSLN